MILVWDDNCGVFANKHIPVLSFVVSSLFLLRRAHLLAQTAWKKTKDVYLVRGFIEAEQKSIHSSPYNCLTLGYHRPAVISSHLGTNTSSSGLNHITHEHSKVATPFWKLRSGPSLGP